MGLLLIAAALCLTCRNILVGRRAGKAAQAALIELRPYIGAPVSPTGTPVGSVDGGNHATGSAAELEYPDYILDPNKDMPVTVVDGVGYVGVLSIPQIEHEFPNISDWSYDHLKIAPCRYSGTAYNGSLVICAHNYDPHFGQIRNLSLGSSLSLTDMDGNRFEYLVSEIETLRPTQVEDMKTGDWDLTLFTCTIGGRSRLAVRCIRA